MNVMGSRQALAIGALAALAAVAAPASPAAPADGAQLYARTCAACHGKTGQPGEMFAKQGVRNFKDEAWQKTRTDADLEKTIREGKPGTLMVSFKDRFSAEEIKALVTFIRKLGTPKK
jgi:mono/diheme cytochrome c family protein